MSDRRLLVISPHLDDAVLSCGALIAARPGAVVVTVFAGRPDPGTSLTSWDADCGFHAGDDVVGRRREEDAEALGVLGASVVWLDFLDSQYGSSPPPDAVVSGIDAVVRAHDPGEVVLPHGLFHSDHHLASDASLLVAARWASRSWIAYEDAPYRALPKAVSHRVVELRARGWRLRRVSRAVRARDEALKRQAVARYRSQLAGLATPGRLGHLAAFEPERYWELGPAGTKA